MQPTYILQPVSSAAATAAEISVPFAGRIKVGRDPSNDVAFPHDSRMSSVHFELCSEGGECRVRDLDSFNGLFRNGKRINVAILVEGDELQAGESVWRVALRGGGPTAMAGLFAVDDSNTARPSGALQRSHRAHLGDLQLTTDRGIVRHISPTESLTIGRTPPAQWVFDHDGHMSSIHLEIFHDVDAWKVKDLDSTNGTYLNEARIEDATLRSGDELRAGQTRFMIALMPARDNSYSPILESAAVVQPTGRPTALLKRLSDGREYVLELGKLYKLGRSPDSPLAFPDDMQVSTEHATLRYDGDCVRLQDVGSFNGTFVDGRSVVDAQLYDGQRIRVGRTELLVCLPAVQTASPEFPRAAERADVPDHSAESSGPPAAPPQLGHAHDTDVQDEAQRHVQSNDNQSKDIQSSDAPRTEESSGAAARAHGAWDTPRIPEESAHAGDSQAIDREPGHADHFPSVAPETAAPTDTPVTDAPVIAAAPGTDSGATEASPPMVAPTEAVPPAIAPGAGADTLPRPASEVIDWQDATAYARRSQDLQGVVCRSGLYLYRGSGEQLDPVDVGLYVLQSTGGWVLNGSEIENWMEAARQGLSGQPREWLNPAKSDDASWMLPFLSVWGSGQAWLIFSSLDLDEALHNIMSLRPLDDAAVPLLPAMHPQALGNFLAEHDARAVQRFFHPLDAILLEVGTDRRWALFSRHDLTSALRR